MQVKRNAKGTTESGIALLWAIFAAFIAAGFIATMMAAAMAANRNSKVRRYDVEAQYLAEGAVERAKKEIITAIANYEPIAPTGSTQVGSQMVGYTVAPTGYTTIATDPSGIQTLVAGYELDSTAQTGGGQASAHRILNAQATPLFQFAVFYNSDLEILPGPDMTIGGRVHSNRDLYLGSNATLTMNTNYVHAVGKIYRNRKDDPTSSPGSVQIRKWVANPFDVAEPVQYFQMKSQSQMSAVGVTTTSGYDSRFTAGYDANMNGVYTDPSDWLPFGPGALEYWGEPTGYVYDGHTVMSGEHGVTEAVTPSVGSLAMFEPTPNATGGDYDWDATVQRYVQVPAGTGAYQPGYFHSKADLSILTWANGTWKAYDATGIDITASVASAISVKQMYDGRQANGSSSKLSVTQIDIAALTASGKFPANGMLYAGNYGEGTGISANGIRLVNGSTLPGPLMVATPDPLYIWGDYNSVNKKAAAVICDAFNLLSNAWDDSKTKGALPKASNTTYNVAVATGNVDTNGAQYSGGFENLPRFHEDWSSVGATATIKGSFVKLWFSQYATAPWVYGSDRYTAPKRNWTYDSAFNNSANLPPFTPLAVTAVDIVSW